MPSEKLLYNYCVNNVVIIVQSAFWFVQSVPNLLRH